MHEYKDRVIINNVDTDNGRYYVTPDGNFTSVTTMLGKTANKSMITSWRARIGEEAADAILLAAGERGSATHKHLENLYNEYPEATKEDWLKYKTTSDFYKEKLFIQVMITNIVKVLLSNNFKSVAQEIAVWDSSLRLAGRCDSIGYWNDRLILIDYKTSIKTKPIAFIKDYFLQATAYCLMHNSLYSTQLNKFVIIIANEQGGIQTIPGTADVHKRELLARVDKYYAQSH